jgi:hypothetical protein
MSDTLTPLRIAVVALGLLLPTLALIPLGSLWLWQHGYLIHWAVAMLACTAIAYAFERMTLGTAEPSAPSDADLIDPELQVTSLRIDDDPLRKRAEAAVEALAKKTPPESISSWNDILASGLKTVETVATVYHPGRTDPMLRFTVPEALTLIEQVSGRLRPIFESTIPLGNRLTVAQFAQIYRWRGVYDVAERAWSIWRIARVLNPATAATHEVRERLSKSILQWVKGSVTTRLTRAYIREVGNAASDLYSGELRRKARASAGLPENKKPVGN